MTDHENMKNSNRIDILKKLPKKNICFNKVFMCPIKFKMSYSENCVINWSL